MSIQPIRILYGVSSVGLGHARRSLAIASRLRALRPDVKIQIDFLAAEPALTFLRKSGEHVLPESSNLESLSYPMEKDSKNGKIPDISKVATETEKAAKRNYSQIRPLLREYKFLIQDEFVETLFSFMWDKEVSLPPRRVVTTDYIQLENESSNPFSKLKLGYANKMLKKAYLNQHLRIFLDTPDALPQSNEWREWVAANFHVLGPVIDASMVPKQSKMELVDKLFGHARARLVMFNLGGTSIGKPMAEFVIKHADVLSERLDAFLVVLLGPRVAPPDLRDAKSTRITLITFNLDTLKYFKCADCVVTQAGASSLYEIASAGVPCVIMPVANHFEQRQNAERFSNRFGFEILEYDELSVPALREAISNAMSKPKYEALRPTSAAQSAATLIHKFIES
jgi:UDP:flavonoid glycosyltransferase YjiC (YdhE family)